MTPSVNADRLWQSIMDIARIGPTPEGGSCRLALSPEDEQARALLLDWCKPLRLHFERDAIGNMFLRRKGEDDTAPAVAFGSHLDTVPTGGRFDGVFGVLAGLEVMRALDEAGVGTRFPLELVNWTNEEGSRFRPAMMGSRVHAADLVLEDALAITDDKGATVRDALRASGEAGALTPSPRGWACWLEAHIEQGPVMEATGADIGIVTGTVHARYFQLTITGEPSHVGPTTMDRRQRSYFPWNASPTQRSLAGAPQRRGSRTTPTRVAMSRTSRACTATCGMSGRSKRWTWRLSCGRRWTTLPPGGASRSLSIHTPPSVRLYSTVRLAISYATRRAHDSLRCATWSLPRGMIPCSLRRSVPARCCSFPAWAGLRTIPGNTQPKSNSLTAHRCCWMRCWLSQVETSVLLMQRRRSARWR
jgi:Peptidase family M20/M25/M40